MTVLDRQRATAAAAITIIVGFGGLNEIWTHDLLVANEAFFQLNYKPMVAEAGLEPASKWLWATAGTLPVHSAM